MLGVEIILDKGDRNFLSNKKTFGSKLCFFFSVFIEVILIASSILQFFNGNPLDGTIYMLFGIGIAIYFIVIKENQKGGKDNGQ
jgi:hypothetical protein